MNIVHVVVGLAMGGAEKVIFDIAKTSLSDEFNDHKVICLTSVKDRLQDFRNINVHVNVWDMKKSPLSIIKHVRKLNDYLKKNKIDVIHAHMIHAIQIATLQNMFYKNVATVFTPHSINMESKWRDLFLYAFKKYRDADVLLGENQEQFYHTKNVLIPNGIDMQFFKRTSNPNKTDDDYFKVIHIGRYNEAKNHLGLIDAFEEFARLVPNAKLYLVGDGELFEEIAQRISQKSLEDKVVQLGLQKDMVSLLEDKHIFVLPSLWEGFPISLLEAGSMQVPILATAVGAIKELLSFERGTFCSLNDISEKLLYCYNNYNECMIKSENLHKHINDNYRIESVYAKHIELYNNVCY